MGGRRDERAVELDGFVPVGFVTEAAQADRVAEPIPLRPSTAVLAEPPALALDAIVRAKASDAARFGRIDRSVGRSPCARRCRRTDARKR
jgi:hypothetical protein